MIDLVQEKQAALKTEVQIETVEGLYMKLKEDFEKYIDPKTNETRKEWILKGVEERHKSFLNIVASRTVDKQKSCEVDILSHNPELKCKD